MKKFLLPITFMTAVIFTACSSNKEDEKRDMLFLNDTSGLPYNSGNDTAVAAAVLPEPEAPVQPKYTPRRQSQPRQVVVYTPAPAPVYVPEAPVVIETPQPSPEPTVVTGNGETGTTGTETADIPVPAKKEGISKAAKGAIIGGVAGAAAGAIISKKGKGAIIGGVVGAAGGYILGRNKDKKDGRY